MLKRGGLIKSKPIKKQGPKAMEWKKFRNEQFQKDCDEEGLIRCEDTKVGLIHCGVANISPDLHHLEGRDGKLMFDRSKMVWVTRRCHEIIHNR